MRLQLIIDLIMHGTNLTSITLSSVSIFELVGKVKPHKKNGHNFSAEKISYMVCITMFSDFTKTNNSFSNPNKQ